MRYDPATSSSPIFFSGVRAINCHDAHAEWSCEPETDADRLVVVRLFWHRLPLQNNAVRAIVRAVAAGVLPWLDDWHLAPTRPWLSEARSLAAAGLLPIPEGYEPPAHLCDFRRLLPQQRFRLRVGMGREANPGDEDLGAVVRMLQWACDLLGADALLLLPGRDETQTAMGEMADACEPEIVAPPLRGKPHPLSESEQKLAKFIASDSSLAPLFAFNIPVALGPLCRPCVDLLWEAGKLVVEIDDSSHWQKAKYAADRQRDYELAAAGFQVLRITAEEVLQDTAKAMHKIRTCVELRRQS
jgi:very-short-patch-repair endonuclease